MQSSAVSKDTLSFHLCFHIHYHLMHQTLLSSFTYLATFQWQFAPRSDLREHVYTWESMKFHIESFLLVHMD